MAFSSDDAASLDEIDENLQAAVEPTCGMFSKNHRKYLHSDSDSRQITESFAYRPPDRSRRLD
jgi:hypothetical protein